MRDVIRSNPPRAASVDRFERRTGQRGEWASTHLVYCAHARRRGCRGPPDDGGNQDAIKDRLMMEAIRMQSRTALPQDATLTQLIEI